MMRLTGACVLFGCVLVAGDDTLTARRLYYSDNAPEVVFKATTIAPKPKPPAAKPAPGASKAERTDQIVQALRAAAAPLPELKAAPNLAVRYNVLKVIAKGDIRTEVPPDRLFHEGECAAVRIQPNRGGFLYVFTEGTSGKWRTLMPSPELADDRNAVQPYGLTDVPDHYCFEMDDKPGTERLLIVVTANPEDVIKLNDSVKGTLTAADLQPFTAALQSRDLKITRVTGKPAAGEPPYSTFLASTAAVNTGRLVLEIKLKHVK